MTQERIHPEQLAALIDGRVDDDERGVLLAHLAGSDADLDILVEALAVLDELERSSPPKPPRGVRLPGGWRVWVPAAAAAGMVLALLTGIPEPGAQASAVQLALDVEAIRSTPGWSDPPWAPKRGSGDLSERQVAIRAGVRFTDVLVSASGEDRDRTRGLAEDLVRLLDHAPRSAGPVRRIQTASTAGPQPTPLLDSAVLRRIEASLAGLMDDRVFHAAMWIEASRLAALAQDRAFFQRREVRRALSALPDGDWPADVMPHLRTLARPDVSNLSSLGEAAAAVLAMLA